MDPELALKEILEETLPEIHKLARGLLREQLVSIYYLENVHSAHRLIMGKEHFFSVSLGIFRKKYRNVY